MKRQIILMALAVCSCTREELPSEQPSDPESFGTEEIILVRRDGGRIPTGETTWHSITETDTLFVYPFPNTAAPVTVGSTDSTVMVPALPEGNMLVFDCLDAGRAGLVITSEGVSRTWNLLVQRSLHYDLRYDPSTDRLTLAFAQDPSYPVEKDYWERMAAHLHITTIWSYKVGYGSNYMNTRYPRTTVVSGEFPVNEPVFLESLEKEYRKVRELYEQELAAEYAKDPNHAWSSWSGIELKVVIRNPESCLKIRHSRGVDSAYGYSLGFTLTHSLIED